MVQTIKNPFSIDGEQTKVKYVYNKYKLLTTEQQEALGLLLFICQDKQHANYLNTKTAISFYLGDKVLYIVEQMYLNEYDLATNTIKQFAYLDDKQHILSIIDALDKVATLTSYIKGCIEKGWVA